MPPEPPPVPSRTDDAKARAIKALGRKLVLPDAVKVSEGQSRMDAIFEANSPNGLVKRGRVSG